MDTELIQYARSVVDREPSRRPEALWLESKMRAAASSAGIFRRGETDRYIYEQLYGVSHPKSSEILKIRYWRTGQHLPATRAEAERLAKVLNLNEKDTLCLMQAYMDRADRIFEENERDPVLEKRLTLMEELREEYCREISLDRAFQLSSSIQQLTGRVRHLTCLDALEMTLGEEAVRGQEKLVDSSLYRIRYYRITGLTRDIPRSTMLRHLFLHSGSDFLRCKKFSERLVSLGYLPLTRDHTDCRGALTDDLLMGVLELYARDCAGLSPAECRAWLRRELSALDLWLRENGLERYRFLHFKLLDKMLPASAGK